MGCNALPSAVVSASANTGGVPVGRDDDAATADVVDVKLKQPLSPAEIKIDFSSIRSCTLFSVVHGRSFFCS